MVEPLDKTSIEYLSVMQASGKVLRDDGGVGVSRQMVLFLIKEYVRTKGKLGLKAIKWANRWLIHPDDLEAYNERVRAKDRGS
jgi:hypothetical protein